MIDSIQQCMDYLATADENLDRIFLGHKQLLDRAILIRVVEQKLLSLFRDGRLSGTVHTCIGQELTGLFVCEHLTEDDWLTSNHRCHGHFISKTGRWRDLISELCGLSSGICGGVGGSQHLFCQGFLSNGTQGSLLPVAAGLASRSVDKKPSPSQNIGVSFIGEGTFGEGVLYETLNFVSIKCIPLLVVVERNFYSQSTPQSEAMSGSISSRAAAFGMQFFEADTWDLDKLSLTAREAVSFVRGAQKPALLSIDTYRLEAHSKGDDDRDVAEVEFFKKKDIVTRYMETAGGLEVEAALRNEVDAAVSSMLSSPLKSLTLAEYLDNTPRIPQSSKVNVVKKFPDETLLSLLNSHYLNQMKNHGAIFVGEDIKDPYGGAFKVTSGFSSFSEEAVIATPISEACLVGYSIGRAMSGDQVFCEIMFGDFVMNACDQIVNNAAKFPSMYNGAALCPVKIRVVSGGRRGYGPTHSQSLERMFCGVENISIYAISSLIDPGRLIDERLVSEKRATIVVEHKGDYARLIAKPLIGLEFSIIGGAAGSLYIGPASGDIGLLIISYGGTARVIYDQYQQLFAELDVRIGLLCMQQLYPIAENHLHRVISKVKRVLIVEEGNAEFGWSAGIAAYLASIDQNLTIRTYGSKSASIPASRVLEDQLLPNFEGLVRIARGLVSD